MTLIYITLSSCFSTPFALLQRDPCLKKKKSPSTANAFLPIKSVSTCCTASFVQQLSLPIVVVLLFHGKVSFCSAPLRTCPALVPLNRSTLSSMLGRCLAGSTLINISISSGSCQPFLLATLLLQHVRCPFCELHRLLLLHVFSSSSDAAAILSATASLLASLQLRRWCILFVFLESTF